MATNANPKPKPAEVGCCGPIKFWRPLDIQFMIRDSDIDIVYQWIFDNGGEDPGWYFMTVVFDLYWVYNYLRIGELFEFTKQKNPDFYKEVIPVAAKRMIDFVGKHRDGEEKEFSIFLREHKLVDIPK